MIGFEFSRVWMVLLIGLLCFQISFSHADVYTVHSRERAPELLLQDNNEAPTGPIAELVEMLLAQQGHEVSWRKVPWVRSLQESKVGGVDMMIRHTMTKEREAFLLPMLMGFRERKISFLIPTSKSIEINTYEDLLDHEIWATRGSLYTARFDEDQRIQRKDVTDKNLLFRLLKRSRVGVVVTSDLRIFESLAHQHGTEPEEVYKVASYSFSSWHGRYLSIPKKSALSSQYHTMNCALFRMRQSGDLSALFEKWNVTPYVQHFDHHESQKQQDSCDK